MAENWWFDSLGLVPCGHLPSITLPFSVAGCALRKDLVARKSPRVNSDLCRHLCVKLCNHFCRLWTKPDAPGSGISETPGRGLIKKSFKMKFPRSTEIQGGNWFLLSSHMGSLARKLQRVILQNARENVQTVWTEGQVTRGNDPGVLGLRQRHFPRRIRYYNGEWLEDMTSKEWEGSSTSRCWKRKWMNEGVNEPSQVPSLKKELPMEGTAAFSPSCTLLHCCLPFHGKDNSTQLRTIVRTSEGVPGIFSG